MFHVYILASRPHGTLYVGVTSAIVQRVWQHKTKAVPGFTARYAVDRLVWFEAHDGAESAICREKQIKEWRRAWKIMLRKATHIGLISTPRSSCRAVVATFRGAC
jgi:putative endonuclease